MALFLSPEWIRELDEAAAASERLRLATAQMSLTVQQVVTSRSGAADEPLAEWHFVIDHGTVRVRQGRAADPDVTFSEDAATAAAVARGELSAQAAFMLGRLRVGGDVMRLMANQSAIAELNDVFTEVRARTDYGAFVQESPTGPS